MKRLRLEMGVVESSLFDAATAVASDLDTLVRAAMGRPVAALVAAGEDPQVQLTLAKRVLTLLEREFDVRYVNPADTAITMYLWILERVNEPLAQSVAQEALGLGNGWWAPRMARRILSRPLSTSADTVSVSQQSGANEVRLGSNATDVHELLARGVARHLRDSSMLSGSFDVQSLSASTQAVMLSSTSTAVGFAAAADNLAKAA